MVLTEGQKDEILTLLATKPSLRWQDIAEALGLTKGQVAGVIYRSGLASKRRLQREELVDRIRRRRSEGGTVPSRLNVAVAKPPKRHELPRVVDVPDFSLGKNVARHEDD